MTEGFLDQAGGQDVEEVASLLHENDSSAHGADQPSREIGCVLRRHQSVVLALQDGHGRPDPPESVAKLLEFAAQGEELGVECASAFGKSLPIAFVDASRCSGCVSS